MLEGLSFRFDPAEDRIFLRLIDSREEHHLQLTRRVCQQWRTDLQVLANASAQAPARLATEAQATLTAAHHQAMAGQAVVKTERALAPEPEAAPPAHLVLGIACGRHRTDGRWMIRLHSSRDRSWTVMLTEEALHGLVHALNLQVQAASWNLAPMPLQQAVSPSTSVSPLH